MNKSNTWIILTINLTYDYLYLNFVSKRQYLAVAYLPEYLNRHKAWF